MIEELLQIENSIIEWVRQSSELEKVFVEGYEVDMTYPCAVIAPSSEIRFGDSQSCIEFQGEKMNQVYKGLDELKYNITFYEQSSIRKNGEKVPNLVTGAKRASLLKKAGETERKRRILKDCFLVDIGDIIPLAIGEADSYLQTATVACRFSASLTHIDKNVDYFNQVEDITFNLDGV